MSLLKEFTQGEIPSQLVDLAKELEDIKILLDNFEKTKEQKHLKEAANKIRATAPGMKTLGQEYTGDFEKKIVKQCRDEMRALFERARQLRAESEASQTNKISSPSPSINSTSSPSIVNSPSVVISKEQLASTSGSVSSPSTPKIDKEKERLEQQKKEIEEKRKQKEDERAKQQQGQQSLTIEENKDEDSTQISKTKDKVQKKGKDLWSKILEDKKEKGEDRNNLNDDHTLIILGDKNSGKSTLINKIQEKSETITPSGTMEYSYSRRIKKFSTNQSKDVTHTWEISTASSYSNNNIIDIFDVVLTPQNLSNSTVLLVLDLSKPAGLVDNLLKWLDIIRNRIEDCFKELRLKTNPQTQGSLELMKKKSNFILEDHPDRNSIKPFGIPVILVGTKYDILQDTDSISRKIVCKTLRYIAHVNGASLVFVSKEDETLMSKFRTLLMFFMFQNNKSLRSGGILDNSKPLFVPVGVDTLDQIGSPLTDSSSKESEGLLKQWREGWKQTFVEKEKSEENQENEDQENFAKFPEPAVDAARAEKEKSFERYKRDSSSRARFGVGISPSAHYERSIAKQRN